MGTRADSSYAPFRLFVAGLMVVVAVGSGRALLIEGETGRAMVLALLIAPHMALHWYVDRFQGPRSLWAYFLAQGLLALALSPFLAGVGYVLAVYAPLVGEALGFIRSRAGALFALVGLWVASLVAVVVLDGDLSISRVALQTLPTLLFVALAVFLYRRQVEERERAQALAEEVAGANRRLEAYALEIEELTIAAERQRMARELHDTLAQGLAGLIMRLEAASDHLATGSPERARQILLESMDRARATLAESRNAIDDLRASAPSLGSLSRRVRELAAVWGAESGIEIEVLTDGVLQPEAPASAVSLAVEMIVSEALTNVGRHARATHVVVRLTADADRLQVSIEDDGLGFGPAPGAPVGRYGIVGMRERADLAGGSLEIDARPGGGGTIVSVDLPLAGADGKR